MAEITIRYKRSWQIKSYESETLELGIMTEGTIEDEAEIYRQLASIADGLMAERLNHHKSGGF
jgi:hypothetical protein